MTKEEVIDQLINIIKQGNFSQNKAAVEGIVKEHGIDIFFAPGSTSITLFDILILSSNKDLFDYVWSKIEEENYLEENHAKILQYACAAKVDFVNALIQYNDKDFLEHVLKKMTLDEKYLVFSKKSGPEQLIPLLHALRLQRREIAELIVKERLNFPDKNEHGFTSTQLMLLDGYDPRLLIENDLIQPSEVENAKKIAIACAFLEYAYSQTGFYIRPDLVIKFYQELVKDNVEESDVKFLKALEIINSGKPTEIHANQIIKVVRVPYKNHAAFATIISDKAGVPMELAYCDSYLPFENLTGNCGETRFFIKYSADAEKCLAQIDGSYPYFCVEKIAEIFSEFVHLDSEGEMAAIGNIPTQKQEVNRINCAFKSTNIAMRSIVQMMNPQLKYELNDESTLRNDYKKFRRKAIDNAITILEEALCIEGREEEYYCGDDYELALRYCRLSLDKSQQKILEKKEGPAQEYEIARSVRLGEMLEKALVISGQQEPTPSPAAKATANMNAEAAQMNAEALQKWSLGRDILG